jgi:flagellar biogenesis protein FliO
MWLAAPETGSPPQDPGSFASSLWQTAVALLLVGLLAVLVLYLLRLAQPGRRAAGPLQLVARLPLSGAHTVYLLQAAGRYLLIGGSPGGLTLLAEISREQAEAGQAAPPQGGAP